MKNITKLNIKISSDFNNFKKNINQIFSLLPYDNVNYELFDSIYDVEKIIDDGKTNLIILNKSAYVEDEIKYLISLDYKNIGIIIIIDSYFKYELFFKNINKGIITVRRPLSINKFIEVIKALSLSNLKKNEKNAEAVAEYRLLDAAKMFLIIYKKLTEDEAHKYVERYAMKLRINIYNASKNLVSYYLREMENLKYEN